MVQREMSGEQRSLFFSDHRDTEKGMRFYSKYSGTSEYLL